MTGLIKAALAAVFLAGCAETASFAQARPASWDGVWRAYGFHVVITVSGKSVSYGLDKYGPTRQLTDVRITPVQLTGRLPDRSSGKSVIVVLDRLNPDVAGFHATTTDGVVHDWGPACRETLPHCP